MSTPAQIAANQRNAQLSTGPTSEDGKSRSSLNAVKTGLTGRTVLLPEDDVALYQTHVSGFTDRYQPVGPEESHLVQSLADTQWRLERIPALELGIYAMGRLEFAELFPQEDPAVRYGLIEAKTYLAYGRQLNNLGIQESRLRRQFEKDAAVLRELQGQRKRQAQAALDSAAREYIVAVHEGRHDEFDPAQLGFEFSIDQIEIRAMDLQPNLFAEYERKLAKKRKVA